MLEDSDDEIQFVQHIKPRDSNNSRRKYNAPNPFIRKGTESEILETVRKKLRMENTLVSGRQDCFPTSTNEPETSNLRRENTSKSVQLDHRPTSSNLPETPIKSNPICTPLALTPKQIEELTENCMDSDNEPSESPSKKSGGDLVQLERTEPSTTPTVKASSSLLNKTSRFFGAGTSHKDAFKILNEGARQLMSPKKSVSPKGKRLSKNSPIRLLPKVINSSKKSPRHTLSKSPLKSPSPGKSAVCRSLLSEMNPAESSTENKDVLMDGPYYFEAFSFMMKKVQTHPVFSNLLLDSEIAKISIFSEPRKELQLYVRLLNRKDKWNRVKDIHYKDIDGDLHPLFDALEKEGLVLCDTSDEKLDELLYLLNVKEIKIVGSMFKVKTTGTKDDIVKALLSMHKTQPVFGAASPLRYSVLESLGRCVRLTSEWRQVFRRSIIMFSMFHSHEDLEKLGQEQALLLLQVKLERMAFPVKNFKDIQYPVIFSKRDQLIRYEEARELSQKLMSLSSPDAIKELIEKALLQFVTLIQLVDETKHVLGLPEFLRKFSAGSIYASMLTRSVDEVKKLKGFIFAVHILRTLLGQNVYRQSYRGTWILQLCTVLHVNIKDYNQAALECYNGLSDKSLGVIHHMNLQKRAQQILKTLKGQHLHQKLQSVITQDNSPKSLPHVQIPARLFPGSRPGLKRVYIRETVDGKEYMSVEELVREYFKSDGFVAGFHDEGAIISSLCYLSLWDIIYDVSIQSAFISPYQDKPLDWCTKEFYLKRKLAISKRFADMLSKSEETLSNELMGVCKQYSGTSSVVSWVWLERVNIQVFLECLTIPTFIAICRRLIEDVKSFRSGFPDLILWNPSQKKCMFVEVKSPNDILSLIQCLWLKFLIENGATALVANVKDTGSKSAGVAVRP